jgi:hypothetical protein
VTVDPEKDFAPVPVLVSRIKHPLAEVIFVASKRFRFPVSVFE